MKKTEIEMIPSEQTFVEWVRNDLEMTNEEAGLLLGYVLGHGCGVYIDASNTINLVDVEDLANGVIAKGFDEIIERISEWNYEFLQDDEVVGEFREQILMDAKVIHDIECRMNSSFGIPIGTPTVKELIAILSKFPEDCRVSCCGADNHLHWFVDKNCLTIDSERWFDV